MKYLIVIILVGLQGCSLFNNSPNTKSEPQLNELWRYTLNTAGDAEPVIVGDTIYFASYPNLYAASSTDSLIFWESLIDNTQPYQGEVFIIDDESIIINQIRMVKAYNKLNGSLLWEYDGDEVKIVSINGHEKHPHGYYFVARGGNLVSLSKSGLYQYIEDVDSTFGLAGVVYRNDNLFLYGPNTINGGFTRGLLFARDYETRKEIWRYETDHCGFYEKPIIEDGILYAASRGNSPQCEVVALNSNDGSVIWNVKIPIGAQKILATSTNVIINRGAGLEAFSKADGSKMWSFSWESSGSLIQPVYESGYVYMSNHGSVFILDEVTGELVHKAPSPGGYIWHLTVNENRLFVQTSRQLIAYEPWHLKGDQ